MNKQATISRNHEILSTDLGDEVMMMSIKHGEYYALDPIGARIWHLIAEPTTIQSLCEALCVEFDVSKEACYEDVTAFVTKLYSMELIEIS